MVVSSYCHTALLSYWQEMNKPDIYWEGNATPISFISKKSQFAFWPIKKWRRGFIPKVLQVGSPKFQRFENNIHR